MAKQAHPAETAPRFHIRASRFRAVFVPGDPTWPLGSGGPQPQVIASVRHCHHRPAESLFRAGRSDRCVSHYLPFIIDCTVEARAIRERVKILQANFPRPEVVFVWRTGQVAHPFIRSLPSCRRTLVVDALTGNEQVRARRPHPHRPWHGRTGRLVITNDTPGWGRALSCQITTADCQSPVVPIPPSVLSPPPQYLMPSQPS